MFIIENITDIFLPIWTLWVRCVLFSEFEILIYALLSQNIDVEIYALFGVKFWRLDLRAFVAKRLRPDLRTFSAIFFDWKGGSANFFAFRMYGLMEYFLPRSSQYIRSPLLFTAVMAHNSFT